MLVFTVLKNRLIKILRRFLSSFYGRRSVNYLGGVGSLPAPLSPEEEAEALDRAENDPKAKALLVERNLRLVVYIAKKFENTGVGIEDLVSIGTVGLIKAVNTFHTDRGIKLATYASRCIENEILMYIRKTSGIKAEISIDEPLHTDRDGNELTLSDVLGSEEEEVGSGLEADEERRSLLAAVAALDERERLIIEMRFGLNGRKEKTQKEVADELGISQSYISRLEKKIIERLRKQLSLT